MQKYQALYRTKRIALLLLISATGLFILSLFLPPTLGVEALKSVAEAAMVGGLADWFAVSALFRRIPIPFISRHTAIVPRNKQRIADNLGAFVEERFLNADALSGLVKQHNLSQKLADWLLVPANQQRFAQAIKTVLRGMLAASNDDSINRFIRQAVNRAIEKVDFRHSAVILLESLTRENRHQAVLDTIIRQVVKLLEKPQTRQFVAGQISAWFQREYPTISRVVSSEWLGEKGARKVASLTDQILLDVARDPDHQLRRTFNRAVKVFIHSLEHDPKMAERMTRMKQWLKEDEQFALYINQIWQDLRGWLHKDLDQDASRIGLQLQRAASWMGETLSQDPQLIASFNQHIEQTVRTIGPESARFLTRHISDTIKGWDDKLLVDQIEMNIGKDLQFIRINGTVVGGLIGLLLFALSQLPWLLQQL
ncbi:DUF445 family protein [Rosenbergiella australiborealis]|uniref:DUF445 family protein n=2 Tax=Rosenbergiella TaxID=1356488 RepID=A0ABS5T0Q1_9GAMM|nr:DUF445 family protein [Rosenbergiella australiborealis]MBT0725911.1 DUF445 family protein [Rosenbergiella australiborealis]